MACVDLDGHGASRLSDEDAKTVRTKAEEQRAAKKAERQHPEPAPRFLQRAVIVPPEPSSPAKSIIDGVKALKEKLLTEAQDLRAHIVDIFPKELVEIFPDLEKSISKMMEGAVEVIEYCNGKPQGEAAE